MHTEAVKPKSAKPPKGVPASTTTAACLLKVRMDSRASTAMPKWYAKHSVLRHAFMTVEAVSERS